MAVCRARTHLDTFGLVMVRDCSACPLVVVLLLLWDCGCLRLRGEHLELWNGDMSAGDA